MATNSGKGHRQGAVVAGTQVRQSGGDWQKRDERAGAFMDRIQLKNPVTGRWVKVDTSTGRIIDEKRTDGPYKGVAIDSRQQRKN